MDDVLLSLQDLLAIYPVVRKIEAEQLALSIQRDANFLTAIQTYMDAIKRVATTSPAVTGNAVAALQENDGEIRLARNLDVRAGLVADDVLIARNFVGAAVAFVRNHGLGATKALGSGLGRVGSELKEVGDKSWDAVKVNLPNGIGIAARILPITALVVLLGPTVVGLAALLRPFRSHAQAIKQLGEGKLPPQDRPNGEAPARRKAPIVRRTSTGRKSRGASTPPA